MSPDDLGSAERAIAELALRRLIREHPEKWREAWRGNAAVASWFEDQIRDVYMTRPDTTDIIGAVVQLAIMDARRNAPRPASRGEGQGEGPGERGTSS